MHSAEYSIEDHEYLRVRWEKRSEKQGCSILDFQTILCAHDKATITK